MEFLVKFAHVINLISKLFKNHSFYNFQRMNVMLTRAKGLMIIIGNDVTLSDDEHWLELIKFCAKKKHISPAINLLPKFSLRTNNVWPLIFFIFHCLKHFAINILNNTSNNNWLSFFLLNYVFYAFWTRFWI